MVQPPFRLNIVHFAVRTNHTNFDIIPKLKPVHHIFNDREVFVLLRTNDEISKGVAYNFTNYKDYPSDYPSIALIVVLTLFQVEPVDIDPLEQLNELV